MTAFFVIILFFAHWIADFVCQTRQMANNKSKSLYWLSAHVATYTLVMGILLAYHFVPLVGLSAFIFFISLNGILHFAVDFSTSKLTGYFYMKTENTKALKYETESEMKRRDKKIAVNSKMFFTTIGFDQWIHAACLVYTFEKVFLA